MIKIGKAFIQYLFISKSNLKGTLKIVDAYIWYENIFINTMKKIREYIIKFKMKLYQKQQW